MTQKLENLKILCNIEVYFMQKNKIVDTYIHAHTHLQVYIYIYNICIYNIFIYI